jgi:hypothetical protein
MTVTASPRIPRRRVRDLQRFAHLLAGVAMIAFVYVGPILSDGFLSFLQWVVVPVIVASGVALWKWPKIRAAFRRRR